MKKRSTAMILCLLLGGLGIHRFYLGEAGKGILYIITVGGFLGLIPLIDLIIWMLGSEESFDQKYNAQAIQKEQTKVQKEMLAEMKKSNS
jgi:TM2 domain-containing membrane protein YozV